MTYWHSKPMMFRHMPEPFTRSDLSPKQITPYSLDHDPRYLQILYGIWIDRADDRESPTPIWAGPEWLRTATRLHGFRLRRPEVIGALWTAARLYGLPVPNRINDKPLHVAGGRDCSRIVRRDVVLHRHQDLSQVDFFGLPLITVPHLLVELGHHLSLAELVQFGDAAVSNRFCGPKTTLDSLKTELAARGQVRERRRLRKAFSLVRPTVDSPRETWLRLWIVDNGFPEPIVHPQVRSRIKNVTLRPDLGYPELKLAIEYEGDQHRTSSGQFNSDIERRQLLEAEGWTVLRVTKNTNMATFRKLLATRMHNLA